VRGPPKAEVSRALRLLEAPVSATVALLALHLGDPTIPTFATAQLLVGLLCQLANLDDGLRFAYICVAVIMATEHSAALSPPIGRIASVAVGSAIGVGVSWVFEKTEVWFANQLRTCQFPPR
jgi:hypothetical protein